MSDDQLPNLRGNEGQGAAGGAGQAPPPGGAGAPSGPEVPAGGRAAPAAAGGGSLAAVMQLEVPVSIELGRTRMAVEDVLALGRGSVVQLDRLVGQPVEVFVSDKPFATGEVVVMGEKFGVRIIRIREPVQAGEVPS
ncbi:MAG: flagellar motor switch protein FliN [Gemmatimonadetes bacterium]|nr:flagellar motor switch protein FliN [Gemmatimonadota bacterium]NNF12942.1 flagellar motor switch protein FliN [Gemmatimonadota bacterium]